MPLHVRAEPGDYAEAVLLPGDPLRAKYIAETYLDSAVQRNADQTVRSWHVYYLQNSHADDIAYVLQQAFTPNNITAQPTQSANTGNGMQTVNGLGAGQSGMNNTAGATSGTAAGGSTLPGTVAGTLSSGTATQQPGAGVAQRTLAGSATSNPLLGGLDQSAQGNDVAMDEPVPLE